MWLGHSEQDILHEDFPNYNFSVSTPDMFLNSEDIIQGPNHTWHGAAIAWHNDLHSSVAVLQSSHDRFAAVLLNLSNNSKILIVSLYAPTSGKDDDFLECLNYLEEFLITHTPGTGSVLIGADSNCSGKSSTRRQLAWSDFCQNFNLQLTMPSLPTFHHL